MTERLKMERGSSNVFHDIGFPPEEAQNLLLRRCFGARRLRRCSSKLPVVDC